MKNTYLTQLGNSESGLIEIICGPMFSGKTERLISHKRILDIAKVESLVFYPAIDTRYGSDRIATHGGTNVEAIAVKDTKEIKEYLANLPKEEYEKTNSLFFDEVQFFDSEFPELINKLANEGKSIFCAGLDLNFLGKAFTVTRDILAIADSVIKLAAICAVCKKYGTRSQRLVGGKPASKDEPEILLGHVESYQCRCRAHHIT